MIMRARLSYKGNKHKKHKPNYKTGDFRQANPQKYAGDLKKPIKFRSSYELRFMRILESNPEVEWWNFENIIIPYTMRHSTTEVKRHNYIMDFQVKKTNGKMLLCEVKPANKTPLNEAQMRISPDHRRNAHKWKAAIAWCKHNNHEFKIINEKHLGL